MSFMKDTHLRTAEQLGQLIRQKRREKGFSQLVLAERLGVERKWVMRLESGNAKAELGLVLKAMAALDIQLRLGQKVHGSGVLVGRTSRLDDVFARVTPRK